MKWNEKIEHAIERLKLHNLNISVAKLNVAMYKILQDKTLTSEQKVEECLKECHKKG